MDKTKLIRVREEIVQAPILLKLTTSLQEKLKKGPHEQKVVPKEKYTIAKSFGEEKN